jgi:hypothetical protein
VVLYCTIKKQQLNKKKVTDTTQTGIKMKDKSIVLLVIKTLFFSIESSILCDVMLHHLFTSAAKSKKVMQ